MKGHTGAELQHDSAVKQVSGAAEYTDDIREPAGTLHAYLGCVEVAHGRIERLDLSAVLAAEGVRGVITSEDVTGVNDISAVHAGDEPLFPESLVEFHGQPLFAVVAETRAQARRAAELAEVEIAPLNAVISVNEADELVTKPLKLERGDVAAGMAGAAHRLEGRIEIGGQDHMYLEGHIAFAIPGEDAEVTIWASTQHPTEAQVIAAQVMGVAAHDVTVKVRRMGGGFGGKESQMNLFCCVAALAARKFGAPVKVRPDRDQDMIATGKRHDFVAQYEVGFDGEGRIEAVEAELAARCGFAADLSGPVTDRALFHADNAYFYPHVRLRSKPMKTNTVSNTAFRGFGGPQGVVMAERMIEEIAYALGKDPLDVRKANFYGGAGRDVTPYHQVVEDNILERLVSELEESCDYRARRAEIEAQPKGVMRRGIALTPVKFGISFTATWYNQAGCLLHVYKDGSILLNHGGTEMGQGLHTKMCQVVAEAFGVSVDLVRISATATDKVPNTSATAASSGSDLNGMAALNACEQIKARLEEHAGGALAFEGGRVRGAGVDEGWASFVAGAYMNRVQLSAAGFYKTPEIHWDRESGRGQPFYYFAYGAACSEVEIDTLTGEYRVLRADVLHDVGRSLNPALDRGQVEGAFVQGMGWLTTEELWWDESGRLRTHAPSTYKIPLASDMPREFNVALAEWSENPKRTVKRSKAVGEPPFMLGISVFEALGHAVASVGGYETCPRLDAPATPERVLMAVERLR